MTLPIWPVSLPQEPLRAGYTENYPSNLLRSEGSTGVAKVRRKGAPRPFSFTASFKVTAAQRVTLIQFVNVTLQEGALRFDYTHPVDGTAFEARIVPQGDNLFTLTPRKGSDFTTSLTFEVLP